MQFPLKYKCLNQNEFEAGDYKIVPIRYEDRMEIMKWRNEQIFHLRQNNVLSEDDQENYFGSVIKDLFFENKPSQLLFSFLLNNNLNTYFFLDFFVFLDFFFLHLPVFLLRRVPLGQRFFLLVFLLCIAPLPSSSLLEL